MQMKKTQAVHDNRIQPGLVSVIMGNYNTPESYLRESIDSVLAQTYTDFELIIVDDASTDDSPAVLRSYDDPRIRILYNEKNMGLAATLNKALDNCRGEFVARMDTDDICLPQRFERQVDYLGGHPEVIVCGTWVEKFFEPGANAKSTIPKTTLPDRESYLIYLLYGNYPTIIHPSVMYNRRMLLQHDLRYNTEYRYAEDYRMWLSCARCGSCVIIPEVLLRFRCHAGSISVQKNEQQQENDYSIIQEQLDSLHIKLPEDIREHHLRLFLIPKPYDLRIKEWLKQLIAANKKYKVYNQRKFKRIAWNGWTRVCYFAVAKYHKHDIKKYPGILLSLPLHRYPELIKLFFRRKKKLKEEAES